MCRATALLNHTDFWPLIGRIRSLRRVVSELLCGRAPPPAGLSVYSREVPGRRRPAPRKDNCDAPSLLQHRTKPQPDGPGPGELPLPLRGAVCSDCCGRFHRGEAEAPTAEQLMRSRYSAFVVLDAAYLLRAWHPDTRPAELELDPAMQWRRLDIISTSRGGPLDSEGTVEFKAHFRHDGASGVPGNQPVPACGPPLVLPRRGPARVSLALVEKGHCLQKGTAGRRATLPDAQQGLRLNGLALLDSFRRREAGTVHLAVEAHAGGPPSTAPTSATAATTTAAMMLVVVNWPSLTGMREALRLKKDVVLLAGHEAEDRDNDRGDKGPDPHHEALPGAIEPGHPAGHVAAAVVGHQQDCPAAR